MAVQCAVMPVSQHVVTFWDSIVMVGPSERKITISPRATDGIFKIQNDAYRGFQQGSPQLRSKSILVDLYCKDGGVELLFDQKNYANSVGLTQPEINRVVQSLRKREQS